MWRKMMVFSALGGLIVTGSAAGRIHTVQRGDTLSGIATRYGVGLSALAAANGLADPNRIFAGSVLSIPGSAGAAPAVGAPAIGAPAGRSHAVARGENLGSIALRYGVSVASLAAANGLPDPDFVRSGTVLRIPAATGAPLRQTPAAPAVVAMPPATMASARPAPRIVVPADRAGLRTAFLQFSRLAGVPSDLAMALAWQESGWQRNRVSSTMAVGVMQLMPDTVDFVSTQLLRTTRLNPWDPVANIRMGTRFLRYLLDANGGNVDRALASYYQGLRSVRERGMLPETERFVANVKALRGRL